MNKIEEVYTYIVKYILNGLIENGIIEESDSAIYFFGLYEGGIFIFNVLLTLIIASIMQNLWIGIVFFVSFFPVRRFAGGFHAKTRLRCLFVSIFIVIGAMKGIETLKRISFSLLIALLVMVVFVLIFLVPIPNARKTLSEGEIKTYKRKFCSVVGVECTIGVLFGFYRVKTFISIIVTVLIICLGLALLGILEEKMI